MGKEIISSAFSGTLPEQEIIVISFGIVLPEQKIIFLPFPGKLMGKEIISSAFPGTLPEQEIIVISFGIALQGKEIVFLSIAGKDMGKGTSAAFSQPSCAITLLHHTTQSYGSKGGLRVTGCGLRETATENFLQEKAASLKPQAASKVPRVASHEL